MRRIAITGHRGLSQHTTTLVDGAIRAALAEDSPDITGISCLADGADQIFAHAVIDAGGTLVAVIPAARYRDGLPPDAIPEYDRLLSQASDVRHLPYTESDSESHMAASELMIHEADQLYAVWDGQPARGYGGTADVVSYARERCVPVRVIWPDGAQRDQAPGPENTRLIRHPADEDYDCVICGMEGQFTERCSVVAFHVHEAGRTFTRYAHASCSPSMVTSFDPAKMYATAAVSGAPAPVRAGCYRVGLSLRVQNPPRRLCSY